jgi:GDPmannose 4,6-dehydratase
LFLHYGDLADRESGEAALRTEAGRDLSPGAQSHVRVSFDIPEYTSDVTVWARFGSRKRFAKRHSLQILPASSSEMFEKAASAANRDDPFGRAVIRRGEGFAYWATINYRESYVCARQRNLFNHESRGAKPLHPENYTGRPQ